MNKILQFITVMRVAQWKFDVVLRNVLHEAEVHSPAPLKRTLVFLGHVLGFHREGAVVVAVQVPRTFKNWLPLSPVG